ncbi:MAG: alpha-ketoglutarate-dependent dioxygenase AlkB [Sediminibacterium sp.]|nr:alpha-ketoglutarate-dependent dioxygenase AlkB [Sediminibacterium sp.]
MDLFNNTYSFANLLPYDGTVNYFGTILTPKEAGLYLNHLLQNIRWENDRAIIFGKLITTKRKVAWYGSQEFEYTYSGISRKALPWTSALLELKQLVEAKTGEQFNSCLLNLYHNGDEGMAWHSDAEKDLKKHGAIASLSFGAPRKFAFKHKVSKATISMVLEPGSLLVMKGATQDNWLHRLPPSKRISEPRINLTFRTIVSSAKAFNQLIEP